ncbi:Coiled-coil domain-containing protein 25 [Coemansia erecta]|uniref:Coiled-coil domain-containing protein 25 n=1 Tax=Coemansia asiatica TaxID=1052880 RepID=A0A9W8CM58_9FUNG|nr:Coiled-coil domain-containing protein 25 [Coemansia asiatica]KAJ2853478.1 Coiled-coil domain-containing protein 25 [Coemansia erecta]KAJ2879285.1 Coiled-coil domain-containing protein 25 [Coemansia asiatica]
MVLYFTSNVVQPPATIYMGKDKFENEDLIKHGWPEDVWFHVDKLSSAHVYLRLEPGMTWETIPKALLDDLAQLCKANSIEGNKKDNIVIIYTPWANLFKRGDMATGQVSFKNPQMVKRVLVVQRENAIVNRLSKTKRIEYPDLYQQRQQRDRDEKRSKKNEIVKKQSEEKAAAARKKNSEQEYKEIFKVGAKPAKPATDDIFGDGDEDGSDDETSGRFADDLADFI